LMENLEKSFLHCVFDGWISCLHLVVESGGEWWKVDPNIAKEFCYYSSSLSKKPSTNFPSPLYSLMKVFLCVGWRLVLSWTVKYFC
jgi:hypothetical protein